MPALQACKRKVHRAARGEPERPCQHSGHQHTSPETSTSGWITGVRLQTERLVLYYAHRDDRQTPLEESMEAFDRLIRAGKVRAIGTSNLKGWRIAEAN